MESELWAWRPQGRALPAYRPLGGTGLQWARLGQCPGILVKMKHASCRWKHGGKEWLFCDVPIFSLCCKIIPEYIGLKKRGKSWKSKVQTPSFIFITDLLWTNLKINRGEGVCVAQLLSKHGLAKVLGTGRRAGSQGQKGESRNMPQTRASPCCLSPSASGFPGPGWERPCQGGLLYSATLNNSLQWVITGSCFDGIRFFIKSADAPGAHLRKHYSKICCAGFCE